MEKQPLVVKRGEAEPIRVLGTQMTFLCGAKNTASGWSVSECVAPKDIGPPPHEHPWDEAYYVLAGEVRFLLGSESTDVGAGDFIYAPAGTLHGFQGLSDQAARVLILDVPGHAEAFFRELEREVKEIPGDLPKVPAIGERHQIHFARPGA